MNVARAEVETARLGESEEEGASDLTRPDYPDLLQRSPGRPLELIEERPLGDALALLRAHLDVARGKQEDPVGDRLDVAVERVCQARAEVHHPAAEVAVDILEVQAHRLLALEAIREVLGVVETGGLEDVCAGGALVGARPRVRGRVPPAVAICPSRALAAEEVPKRSTEGRRALGPAEASHCRSRLAAARAASVGFASVTALLFDFVLVVFLVID